jgi:hypothetical protein
MKTKTVLLGVAILAAGLMIMPYTVSVYTSGSHLWYYDGVTATWDDEVECNRCHNDAGSNDVFSGGSYAYHLNKPCTDCHQAAAPAAGEHTGISTLECANAACHDEAAANFTATDPHYEVYQNATILNDVGTSGTANEACIACHTDVDVVMDFDWSEVGGTIWLNATRLTTGWQINNFE